MVCCAEMNPYNSENSHIFQINRYYKPSQKTSELLPDSQKETITSTSARNTNPQEQQKKKTDLKK